MTMKFLLLFAIGLGVLALDQASKFYVHAHIPLYHSVIVIPDFFSLTHVRNPGAAFGILSTQPETFRQIFFLIVSVLALGMLLVFFIQTPPSDQMGLVALSLLLGGAIGNMIDRVRLGEVIDFLDFYLGGYHWYTFNVADSAITVGVSLLMLNAFLARKTAPSPTDAPTDAINDTPPLPPHP
jgi:signal peptidase II